MTPSLREKLQNAVAPFDHLLAVEEAKRKQILDIIRAQDETTRRRPRHTKAQLDELAELAR